MSTPDATRTPAQAAPERFQPFRARSVRRMLIPHPQRLVSLLASLKLTTLCLVLLMVLTIAGTLYQIDHGIHEAKVRFFTAWFFLAYGVLPFPGGKLVMGVFSVNLIAGLATKLPLRRDRTGVWLLHIGLLGLCASAFCTYLLSQESTLTLREGQGAAVSISERQWELSVRNGGEDSRTVTGMQTSRRSVGRLYTPPGTQLRLRLDNFYDNCTPATVTEPGRSVLSNSPDIRALTPLPSERDPAANRAGARFTVEATGKTSDLLLYAGTQNAVSPGSGHVSLALRKRRIPLPVHIRLVDVERTLYPGTQVARSYESTLEISHGVSGTATRRAVVSMNHPLSVAGITLYQSGYAMDADGREISTLQIVKNPVRVLPYAASLLTGVGLLLHFLVHPLFRRRGKEADR